MTTESDNTHVLVGGDSTFVRDLLELVCGSATEHAASSGIALTMLERATADARALERAAKRRRDRRFVIVLADPVQEEWRDVAWRLRRADPRQGVIVLTSRPSYLVQRYWKHKLDADDPTSGSIASGVLGLDDCKLPDLQSAVRSALLGPDSGFWLDKHARHPSAFARTEAGAEAQRLRRDDNVYLTLVHEAHGTPRDEVMRSMGCKAETIRDRLNRAKERLDVENDVQLGARAAALGLVEVDEPTLKDDEPSD